MPIIKKSTTRLGANKSQGFTLIEVMIAFGVIVISMVILTGALRPYINLSKRGKEKFEISQEQAAVSNSLATVVKDKMRLAACSMPHPWSYLKGDKTCADDNADLFAHWTTKKADWDKLQQAILDWPHHTGGDMGSATSKKWYQDEIIPKLSATGCLHCHGSTVNADYPYRTYALAYPFTLISDAVQATRLNDVSAIAARDFTNYKHIVEDFSYKDRDGNVVVPPDKALAYKAILASRFGQVVLLNPTKMNSVLPGSGNISHVISVVQNKVSFNVGAILALSRVRWFKSCIDLKTYETTKLVSDPERACLEGEGFQDSTCVTKCLEWKPPPPCQDTILDGNTSVCPPAAGSPTADCASGLFFSNYTCTTSIRTYYNFLISQPGDFGKPGNFAPYPYDPSDDIDDSACVKIGEGKQFCEEVCPAAVTDINKRCVKKDSCKRQCMYPDYSYDPVTRVITYGKCKKTYVTYQCREPATTIAQETDIFSFTLTSHLYEDAAKTKTIKTITTVDVIK